MIEIKLIEDPSSIDLTPDAFKVFGKLVPSLLNGEWGYRVVYYPEAEAKEDRFPKEDYSAYDKGVFIGAYEEAKLVGLGLLLPGDFAYMYLSDLEIRKEYRGQGIGSSIIEKAKIVAKDKGFAGIYTYAQDNNLAACLFYLHNGFRLGGVDSELYRHTPQEGKTDIAFYLDF